MKNHNPLVQDIDIDNEIKISNIDKLLSNITENYDIKGKIQFLIPEKFPINLTKKEVDDLFLVAVEVGNIKLMDYLIHTDKNEDKPSLNNEFNLFNILDEKFCGDQNMKIFGYQDSNYFDIIKYLFTVEEFKKNIPPKVFAQFLDNAFKDNNEEFLIYCIKEKEFKEQIKTCNFFIKSCETNNLKLLDILFKNESNFTTLSHQSNVELCIKSVVENKNMDILFYLLYEQPVDINFYIRGICSKNDEAKNMLNNFLLYNSLQDKIKDTPQKTINFKKKI